MNREQDDPRKICYSPRILRNMAEICEEFGVGVKTVKSWIKQGAPIVVEGKGSKTRYCSEVSSLLVWRLARFRRYQSFLLHHHADDRSDSLQNHGQ